MSVRSPTTGPWSSSQWRPDNEFETDRILSVGIVRASDDSCNNAAPRQAPMGRCVSMSSSVRRDDLLQL